MLWWGWIPTRILSLVRFVENPRRRNLIERAGRECSGVSFCSCYRRSPNQRLQSSPRSRFLRLGAPGLQVYEELVGKAAELGLLVIGDVKRGDIGSTAEAYADAHLDVLGADAVTVNPYFGTDGMEPFLTRVRDRGKGVFVLVRTSNPSAGEIQDVEVGSGGTLYSHVAGLVRRWGEGTLGELGYCSVGAVVGGTGSDQAGVVRRLLPEAPLLIPGYGAQGASALDLAGLFGDEGRGAIVNSSRGILYAYRSRGGDWRRAAREEAEEMRKMLWRVAHGN